MEPRKVITVITALLGAVCDAGDRGANLASASNFIFLTNRVRLPDEISGLSIRNGNGSLTWWLNVEPACSQGFRLSRPLRTITEDLALLAVQSRDGVKSTVQSSQLVCNTSQWQGQTVIAGVAEIQPFAMRSETNRTVRYNGSNVELFETIAQSIGFKYSVVEPADRRIGAEGNATYGLVGMMLRDEIDVSIIPTPYSHEPLIDLVWPHNFGRWVVVIPKPVILYDLLSNAKPFGFDVWICLIASIVAVSLAMWTLTRLSGHRSDLWLDVLYNISLVTGQGGFNPKYLPGRFLAATWNLGAFVIVFSYTSILISFITARQPEPLIRNLEDFMTKRTLKPVALQGHTFSYTFLTATSGLHKEIGNVFRSNPDTLVKTAREAIDKVIVGRYGYITGVKMAESAVFSDFLSTRKCRITVLELPEMGFVPYAGWNTSTLVPALTKKLRKSILSAIEGGLIVYFDRKYMPKINCFSMQALTDAPVESPLILTQIQTAFLILGLGVVASIAGFMGERAWPYFHLKS